MAFIYGTNKADMLTGTSADDMIDGGAGNDTIIGGGGLDSLYGGTGNDTITGGSKDDLLDGGTGKDHMVGGAGNDTYDVDNVGDVVVELAGVGEGLHDMVHSTISITKLWDNVEDAQLMGTGALKLTGNDGNNSLFGNGGANFIDGGLGADSMEGGKGSDTYVVDSAGDTIHELSGQGTDLVKSSVNFTLSSDLENLILTGANNISGTGNSLNNSITGNDGANMLDGGAGADKLSGGKGDDSYLIDNAGDKVIEGANALGGGHDHVFSSVSFSLAALVNVEDLALLGTGDINATGNALANLLQGNGGDNIIDGGKGADTMSGYGGNDTYYVDNVGDMVFEDQGKGEDMVISTIAFNDAITNVENYTFKTSKTLDFTGNSLDNWIEGGSGKDHIVGGGGHDHLYGNAGNDILIGGSGNDTINGGTGADLMEGYGDNDVYTVDNVGDKVIEAWNDGLDSVVTTVSITHLFDNVEGLYFGGLGNINGTGNDLDNVIYGNSGNNAIDGGAGKDEIYGMHGNDTLTGDTGADQFDFNMHANDGHDTIKDFLKAEDVLLFATGDLTQDGKIDMNDILSMVSNVVDHGQGKAVDVFFNNGAEITFSGAGTAGNTIHALTDLVDSSHVQVL